MKKEANPVYIKISPSTPALPYFLEDDLTKEQEQALLSTCPQIHLSSTTTYEQVSSFIIELFAYYYQIPLERITLKSDLADDVERLIWAKELEVPFEGVTYARIFCGVDKDGNPTGGIEDKGLIIAMFFLSELSQLVGIEIVENPSDSTFTVMDGELGSYYDCVTVEDLVDLIYSVCEKLKASF